MNPLDFPLLADENVHLDIVTNLKRLNFDIISAVDVGLSGSKDRIMLDYAVRENRILLTGDKDFGGLLEFGFLYGKGKVVLLRYTIMDIKKMTDEIVELLNKEKNIFEKTQTLMVVLSEGRYRIHQPLV